MGKRGWILLFVVCAMAALFWGIGQTAAKGGEETSIALRSEAGYGGPIRRIIRWIIDRKPRPEPEPEPQPEPTPEPGPVPPPPPPPPPPATGLQVLITGPSPRAVRDLSPEQVALLTSRTLRDWTDAACEKRNGLPSFRVMSKPAALQSEFSDLAKAAPDDACVMVAKVPDKEVLVVNPLPADYAIAIRTLSEYAGIKLPSASPAIPAAPAFTDAEWARFTSKTGVVDFGGEKRFLSALPRDLKRHPYGKAPGAVSLADAGVRVIPRDQWPKYLVAQKTANAGIPSLSYGKVPVSDQNGWPLCWAHSATNCGTNARYIAGTGAYLLSGGSVGGPLTNYRPTGGWPANAVNFMQRTGVVRNSIWPQNDINRNYASKPEVIADYPKHKINSTIADLGASGDIFAETATAVLLGAPVAVCADWWQHAFIAIGLDIRNGKPGLICVNSWGESFGDRGRFFLPEGRGSNQIRPDDAQAVLTLVP